MKEFNKNNTLFIMSICINNYSIVTQCNVNKHSAKLTNAIKLVVIPTSILLYTRYLNFKFN